MALKKRNPNDFDPIVINGCLIEPNTIYEIVPKDPNVSSPEIYKDLMSVKERMPGVSNTVSLSQENTGFFAASIIFNKDERIKNDWSEREKKADELYKVFAEPLRMFIADIEQIRVPTNDEFFDKNYDRDGKNLFSVTIGEGQQFNTANPLSRFQLYIAIIEGEVAMKGKREDDEKELGLKDENDIYHSDAQYSYVSIINRKSKKEQTASEEMESIYRFGELLRKDKELLVGMLQYIGVPTMITATDLELNTSYKKNIDGNREKIRAFLDVLERFDRYGETFRKEIKLLERLKTKKGREAIVKDGSTYYMGDVPLGSNPKSVVATLMKDDSLLQTFYNKTED
ncbi:MAG: hypothetical protein LBM02_10020 [Lachnospiraceae bacterium]|jgi:hypothetical protein|nr:hypothetical protein [Lachnospiraceae bacterium]